MNTDRKDEMITTIYRTSDGKEFETFSRAVYHERSLIMTPKRFIANVKKVGDCWEWQGTINHYGYGQIMIGRKSLKAHRLAWMLYKGEIPKDMFVCHKCDNPPCVNPDHLFLGTSADNNHDMYAKGRGRKIIPSESAGENNPRAKLTWEKVRSIRHEYKEGKTQDALAEKYGVNQMSISFIIRNIHWKEEAA
jgi:hypothetical protein